MKITKRIMALILSVIISLSAVCSVPFTVSAKELEIAQAGDSFLTLNTSKYSGSKAEPDVKYMASVPSGTSEGFPVYARFLTGNEEAYYEFTVKSESASQETDELNVEIVDDDDKVFLSVVLTAGSEEVMAVKLPAITDCYIKVYYNSDSYYTGGIMSLSYSVLSDAEPDTMINTIKVSKNEEYAGNIATANDQDWIFVATNDKTPYNVVLENRTESTTGGFKADIYNSSINVVKTITLGAEEKVTVQLDEPFSNESYYICVTGVDGNTGDYAFKFAEPEPETIEVPLNEDYYDSITGCGTVNGTDILSFTTISDDAYYSINTKNIDISTHSWSVDLYLFFDILNGDGERLAREQLKKDSSGVETLKLDPDTTYYIKVYNKYGQDKTGGNYKINITYVLDPEKNEKENGVEWKLGEAYYGNIAARGDKDWFKITTGETTQYDFNLKNISIKTHSWSSDLRFRAVLYNEYSEVINDKRHGKGGESTTRVTLFPNTTYYICVWDPEGTTGDYFVGLTQVYSDVETEKMAMGTAVALDKDYADRIEKIGTEGDVDYLKFTTIKDKAFYTITAQNTNITTGTAATEDQVQVLIRDESKAVLGTICLATGATGAKTLNLSPETTYYLKVYNQFGGVENGGDYGIKITYALDPEADSSIGCGEVNLEKDIKGTIGANGDVDYFAFKTVENTVYKFTLKSVTVPDNGLVAEVLSAAGESYAGLVVSPGGEVSVEVELKPDSTYYFTVTDPTGVGEYSFRIDPVAIDKDLVGMANATELPYDEERYDELANKNTEGDVDYFKFTTLEEKAYYTLYAKNITMPTGYWKESGVQFILMNEHKEELGRIAIADVDEKTATYSLDSNTTYYLKVDNYYDGEDTAGNYKIKLSYVTDPEPEEKENGKTLAIGEQYYSNIGAAGDKDCFVFTTNEDKDYSFTLKNINMPTDYWEGFFGAVYNQYGEELYKVETEEGETVSQKITLDPNTTYYLVLWNYKDTGGDYMVCVDKCVLLGDANLDGAVKIQDATLIQKYLANFVTFDELQNKVSDVNSDGKVNIKDATAIQKYLVDIDTGLPIGTNI